jgi:hypothetical protein
MKGAAMKRLVASVVVASVLAAGIGGAHAHPPPAPSEASALSMLPIAVSVAAPAMILSAGAVLTVVAVESAAGGAVWVLERSSDGARASVTLARRRHRRFRSPRGRSSSSPHSAPVGCFPPRARRSRMCPTKSAGHCCTTSGSRDED